MTTIIASYPRSGNHLVRFLIEFLTGIPTEGCLNNNRDVPIYQNQFPQKPNVLNHVCPEISPIAVKHHRVAEIESNIKNLYLVPSSLLLIVRDPVDAISAHISDKGRTQKISQFKSMVQKNVEQYLNLIVFYNNLTLKKEIIFYEKICASNLSLSKSEINKLVQFFQEQIILGNIVELLASYEEYLSVSASGKKRSWGGARSNGKKYYHLSKLDNEKIEVLLDILREKIKQKQLSDFFEKHYASLFNFDFDCNSVNIFQNNGTNHQITENSNRKIHKFDNGVQVYDDHLIPKQRQRYQKRNVYEAEEEDIFVKIISSIPNQGCFVNIGSAIGYYPILAKTLSPSLSVHAVEPLEKHRNYFIENIKLNGFSVKDFYVHTEAISSVSKDNQDFVGDGYTARLKHDGNSTRNTKKVKTKTLDDFIESISQPVDFLQMDIQGLEVDALKGGTESLKTGKIQTILIGTHGQKIHKQCIEILESYNYTIQIDNFNTVQQPDGIILAHHKLREISKLRATYQIEKGKKQLNNIKNELQNK